VKLNSKHTKEICSLLPKSNMNLNFKEYQNSQGEVILYLGNPNLEKLEELSLHYGDVWHSSREQGYKNSFPEIINQTPAFWYINDLENLESAVNWRINPHLFAVRKTVWETIGGFETDYLSAQMMALDYGYNGLCYKGIIPLYVKGLYAADLENFSIPLIDKYGFFIKNFKPSHAVYMLYRIGLFKPNHWLAFFKAKRRFQLKSEDQLFPPRKLNEIQGKPSISYIIPTMLRQDFTVTLLNDLANQSYLVSEVIVVDATPIDKRDASLYDASKYPFKVIFKWQETKGSCRARNEAIELCTGDYIIFGDDDVRLPSDFVENHIRLLQTYNAVACNGLDIQADNQSQNLEDLQVKIKKLGERRWKVGASHTFSNANSCVRRDYVNQLVGNDINYDGGYGEDNDFGLSIVKLGAVVLQNPFSANLHLKPQVGGYRFWGNQAKIKGKTRKTQPWELDEPVKNIIPVPSPTIVYDILKHYNKDQFIEYRHKYFIQHLFTGPKKHLPLKLLNLPYKILQFNRSVFYAKKLIKLGKRTQ
jgi:glycosyltransferase involved in cell wall biosynthesis